MIEEDLSDRKVDSVELALNITDNLIEIKKLQLNHIWCTKINQEDLNTPKILEDGSQHFQLVNLVFQSIIKLANKINEDFQTLLYPTDDEGNTNKREDVIYSLMITTSAIIQKFKNFYQIKTKHFKKEKYLLDPLTKLQKFYGLFRINLKGRDISKKIDDFYTSISEFNLMLETDNHIK